MPCTYDMEVAGTKYLHALAPDGEIPLLLLFSGTMFSRESNGAGVDGDAGRLARGRDVPAARRGSGGR